MMEKENRLIIDKEFDKFCVYACAKIDELFVLNANTAAVQKVLIKNNIIKFSITRRNDLVIILNNISDIKVARKILEDNQQLLGGVKIKDENSSLEITWPPVTHERRQKAFMLIKSEANTLINEMRIVRTKLKKTIDAIKEENIKKHLITYLDMSFSKNRDIIELKLNRYKI